MKARSNFDPNDGAPLESCAFGPFRLEIAQRALSCGRESVHLPPKAFDASGTPSGPSPRPSCFRPFGQNEWSRKPA